MAQQSVLRVLSESATNQFSDFTRVEAGRVVLGVAVHPARGHAEPAAMPADGAVAIERQNRRVPLTERRRTWMYVVNLGLLPLLPLLQFLRDQGVLLS